MSKNACYKDVQVPETLLDLINHMTDVESYREELRNLGSQWDLLTILGQMSGTGMDMTETRQGFQRLTSELLGQLGLEILNKTVRELSSKAQVTVDIVIRNLFERTADIGFLATDEDIRAFLRTAPVPAEPEETGGADSRLRHEQRVAQLTNRFREYVAKYSVYFNIILLDKDGRVLVQLDEDNNVRHSVDPINQESLRTTAEYVESYRQTDLLESDDPALIYAYRVTESNDAKSAPLGVLCLCFRFENEMQGIFSKLSKSDDWSILTLLDREGRVIASSDGVQVPLGVRIAIDLDSDFSITRFSGREYLSKTCSTKGYQGFFGLGWYGHVMVPVEHAFDRQNSMQLQNSVEAGILDAVMHDSRLFSEKLRSIPVQADHIQDELERTVWNRNVRESDTQSKVLLWNISDAGARTKRVFEESIGNLHETVVSGILNDVEFQARLAVDVMDRNLYERANDCRWWALTSDFRRILAQPEISQQDRTKIAGILSYINGLYTVYTNLLVFDRQGRILAVSDPNESGFIDKQLQNEWVQQTLVLKNSQSYSVSSFQESELYADTHTYIYSAAITDLNNEKQCVGGIGIVFDSTPQFREMLRDALLRKENGDVVDGCFGVFTERNGRIISSTDERFQVGTTLPLQQNFFTLPNGVSTSGIVELEGHYYAVGAQTSSGYREYKVNDGYLNDIVGLILMPLAAATTQSGMRKLDPELRRGTGNTRDQGDVIELATFYIESHWLGIRAEMVREAIRADHIIGIPESAPGILGKTMYHDELITVIDLKPQLRQDFPATVRNEQQTIVVVDTEDGRIGLVVDALGQIPAVNVKRMEPVNTIQESCSRYIEGLVKPDEKSGQQKLMLIIDPDKLLNCLLGAPVPA